MNGHIDGERLSAHLDGALGAVEDAAVAAHAASCAACGGELASLRHLKAALSAAPRKRMPADLALALERRRAAHAPARGQGPRALLWASAGALAAAAFLASAPWRLESVDEIPLEPLLTAHARYSAESPLSGAELAASSYSSHLDSLLGDAEDVE